MSTRCSSCGGAGRIEPEPPATGFGRGPVESWPICEPCGGTGFVAQNAEPQGARADAPRDSVTNLPTIAIARRSSDWHAWLKGNATYWGCGGSPYAAIGSLIYHHPEQFGVIVEQEK